jgi:DNA invertase Pin-like site-specific DNA recombinase
MVLAYIRPDKNFVAVHEQLQQINAYATANNLLIDDEFVDHISQSKALSERSHITHYFQSRKRATLLVYDVWVLTADMADLIQMFSCLLKNEFQVHFIKQSVIMTQESSTMLTLGLMDQLRQTLQEDSKKLIGRPKGSRSSSKFDIYMHEIIAYIQKDKSVSEMARLLGVSRSSLKDYVESRELKEVAFASLVYEAKENAEAQVINTITCPNE